MDGRDALAHDARQFRGLVVSQRQWCRPLETLAPTAQWLVGLGIRCAVSLAALLGRRSAYGSAAKASELWSASATAAGEQQLLVHAGRQWQCLACLVRPLRVACGCRVGVSLALALETANRHARGHAATLIVCCPRGRGG
jgi:hypothetical protein